MVIGVYKSSELGLIPSDWDVLSLNGNFDFLQNNTYSRDCLNASKGDVHNIHYGDVLTKYGSLLDCEMDSIPFVNPDIRLNLVKRLVQSGDVIIADTAEDNTVGKATEVINVGKRKIISGLHTVFIRPHSGLFAERFLGYFINSSTYHDQLLPYIVGTKVSSVSKGSLQETFVLRPPLPEQRRIAEALSDTDALLASMEKLIAKKRAIKQGAMQELLTGKRRLPGFEGEWVETTLNELLQYEQPQKYIVASTKYEESGTPVLTAGKSLVLGYTNECDGIYTNLPVIIFDDFTTESKYITYPFKVKSSAMKLLTSTGICDIRLVYALMQTINFPLKDHQRYWISEYSKLEVKIPPTIAEQTAIAEILSDMDAEIDTLTAKLHKLRNIKQGMMSELLTGRIRLTESEPAKATVEVYQEQKAEPTRPIAKETKRKGHNWKFDDAVMIAGIVDALYSDERWLGRKKVQKCLYLLRRYQGESTAAFKRKAAGPYADEVRYKGGEPIAKKNNYITTTTVNQGAIFARGKNIGKAFGYIQRWDKQADIQWVADQFKNKDSDELELLATVDMAACDLMATGTPVSMQSVKHLIATDAVWKEKLKKQTFSDANIARALRELNTLLQGGS